MKLLTATVLFFLQSSLANAMTSGTFSFSEWESGGHGLRLSARYSFLDANGDGTILPSEAKVDFSKVLNSSVCPAGGICLKPDSYHITMEKPIFVGSQFATGAAFMIISTITQRSCLEGFDCPPGSSYEIVRTAQGYINNAKLSWEYQSVTSIPLPSSFLFMATVIFGFLFNVRRARM